MWRLRHAAVRATADVSDLLSPAERDRAGRFRRAEDGRRFAVARAALRVVLAGHDPVAPQEVLLDQRCDHCGGPHGPITVRSPSRTRSTDVSVSHTRHWSVLAVSHHSVVGVDIEPDDVDLDAAGVAALALTAAERRVLSHLPAAEQRTTLLELWTRKEAVLKARGTGLMDSPDTVEALAPPTSSRASAPRWHIHRLVVDHDHRGTLAVHGPSCAPRLWTLEPQSVMTDEPA